VLGALELSTPNIGESEIRWRCSPGALSSRSGLSYEDRFVWCIDWLVWGLAAEVSNQPRRRVSGEDGRAEQAIVLRLQIDRRKMFDACQHQDEGGGAGNL